MTQTDFFCFLLLLMWAMIFILTFFFSNSVFWVPFVFVKFWMKSWVFKGKIGILAFFYNLNLNCVFTFSNKLMFIWKCRNTISNELVLNNDYYGDGSEVENHFRNVIFFFLYFFHNHDFLSFRLSFEKFFKKIDLNEFTFQYSFKIYMERLGIIVDFGGIGALVDLKDSIFRDYISVYFSSHIGVKFLFFLINEKKIFSTMNVSFDVIDLSLYEMVYWSEGKPVTVLDLLEDARFLKLFVDSKIKRSEENWIRFLKLWNPRFSWNSEKVKKFLLIFSLFLFLAEKDEEIWKDFLEWKSRLELAIEFDHFSSGFKGLA